MRLRHLFQASIARRLALTLLLACGLVWCAIYVTGRLGVHAPDVGNFDREMRLYAGAAKEVLEASTPGSDPRPPLEGLAATLRWNARVHGTPAGFVAFRVFDARGGLVFAVGEAPVQAPAWDGREGFVEEAGASGRDRLLRTHSSDGRYRIEVSSSRRSRQSVYDEVMFSPQALQPLLFGFPLLLLPIWFAVHRGLAPLRRLSRALAARAPDDVSPVAVPAVVQELAPLVDELNAAFARLGAVLERERQFLADAAHELRTPLAVIGAQLDTLRQAHDDASRAAAIDRLEAGLRRAGRLTHQLLALARLDADVEDQPTDVDLADLCRDTLAAHAVAADARRIEMAYLGPDSVPCRCPMSAMESLVDNLVGNAVRYGRDSGRVQVSLCRDAQGVMTLRVSDDGPGIAPQASGTLFERFRRGPGVRGSGAGLGLAIVRSAARQLNASIAVHPGLDGAGVAFEVRWDGTSVAPPRA